MLVTPILEVVGLAESERTWLRLHLIILQTKSVDEENGLYVWRGIECVTICVLLVSNCGDTLIGLWTQ